MSGDRTRICAASDITIASKAEQGTAAIASSIVLADIYLKVRTLSKNGLAARSCAQAQLRQAAAGYDEESIPPRATPSARARRSAPGRHSPSAACAAKRARPARRLLIQIYVIRYHTPMRMTSAPHTAALPDATARGAKFPC